MYARKPDAPPPISRRFALAAGCCLLLAASARAHEGIHTVPEAMDAIVSRLYATLDEDALFRLDDAAILDFITPEEREILATGHVHFEVSAPAIISVMRDIKQAVPPFWLAESGFVKTDLVVTNTENWTYEVWRKEVEAGPVGLGINGFDRHRPHYFVAVGPRDPGVKVDIANRFPPQFSIGWMHEGAFVYHDWDSLLLKSVPDELRGHQLLTTIRGRARDTHLVGGFRKTPHPSGAAPDLIALTWDDDPRTTQAIQWRASTASSNGAVRVRRADDPQAEFTTIPAEGIRIQDRVLVNDPVCHRFTARLRNLTPETAYEYAVGDPKADVWSEPATFTTAPDLHRPFTFISFGDTHKKESWGRMLEATLQRHPEAAFYTIAGDLVDTGQYRDDWDRFFQISSGVFRQRPVLPAIGNHDEIDGLGADMYRAMFALPPNGPDTLPLGNAYALRYSNALFLILASGDSAIKQAAWLEAQLSSTDAVWKIAVFHFPPYNNEEPYPEIRSLWGYLFDKYNVDFVLTGHMHYYMRSKPIRNGVPVPVRGTTHVMSIAIENTPRDLPPADYAAVQLAGVPLYQLFQIDGNRLIYSARDAEGVTRDMMIMEK